MGLVDLKAGDLSDLVAILPGDELTSTSLIGYFVLEDTEMALCVRSGSTNVKSCMDSFYSMVKEF